MNETIFKNAKTAIIITTVLTLFVAGFEVLMSLYNYQSGMNFFDIASCATANMNIYCLILILANLILLPSAFLLYKNSGINLKKEIADKQTLGKDILIGLAALAVTLILSLLYTFVYSAGRTGLAYNTSDNTLGTVIIKVFSLVLVSGICKEIYFRGFAKHFAGNVLGETRALILFNLMFALLDWYNIGFSFFAGLIWILAYKKSGHMLASMIAHGGANLVGIIYFLIMDGVV